MIATAKPTRAELEAFLWKVHAADCFEQDALDILEEPEGTKVEKVIEVLRVVSTELDGAEENLGEDSREDLRSLRDTARRGAILLMYSAWFADVPRPMDHGLPAVAVGSPPPRPKIHEDRFHLAAVDAIWPEVKRWLSSRGKHPSDSDLDLLKRATKYRRYDDGYKIARELDRDGWEPDEELVDILGGLSNYVRRAYRDGVKQWVTEFGVEAPLPIGTVVKHRDYPGETGIVAAVHADVAEYTIRYASHGHVEQGLGTHGFILFAEDCKPMEKGV